MVRTLARTMAALCIAAIAFGTAPAYADTADAIANSIVTQANIGIKNAQTHRVADDVLAQVPPVSQQPVGTQVGLPTGFTYTFDVSMAKPFGNIGNKTNWLPGGVDAVAAYGFNPTTRFVANYYELQHMPVGFNSGTVPFYVQGLPNALGCVDLAGGNANGCAPISKQIDVTTKDRFVLLNFEKLFFFGSKTGRQIPIVITPTYVARWSKVAASPENTDVVAFEYNGVPITGVHTRTAQMWSLAFTLPFLKTPKMFGTLTLAPTTLVHRAGVNVENKAQLYQILYLEYTPNDRMKFFFEPQQSRDYLPADTYAQHIFAIFLGASERVGKNGFVQLILNSGGPGNYSPYGVTALTCQQAGNCANTTVPTVGGLKATQLQIQFGIGSPSVIQF